MRHRPNPSGAAWLSRVPLRGLSEAPLSGPVATLSAAFRPAQPYPRESVSANQDDVANEHRPCHRRARVGGNCALIGAVLEMAKGLRGRQDSA